MLEAERLPLIGLLLAHQEQISKCHILSFNSELFCLVMPGTYQKFERAWSSPNFSFDSRLCRLWLYFHVGNVMRQSQLLVRILQDEWRKNRKWYLVCYSLRSTRQENYDLSRITFGTWHCAGGQLCSACHIKASVRSLTWRTTSSSTAEMSVLQGKPATLEQKASWILTTCSSKTDPSITCNIFDMRCTTELTPLS